MATSHTYLFNNMSRIGNDTCSSTQTELLNQAHSEYTLNNYNLNNCGMRNAISFATKQPNLFYRGGTGSNVGVGGCVVDDNSKFISPPALIAFSAILDLKVSIDMIILDSIIG